MSNSSSSDKSLVSNSSSSVESTVAPGLSCSEAQVFCQKHSHDLCEVLYSRTVHVVLCVVQCVPELREGSGDDVQHRDACKARVKAVMMTDALCNAV